MPCTGQLTPGEEEGAELRCSDVCPEGRKHTGVTEDVNFGSVVFKCPCKSGHVTVSPHAQPEVQPGGFISAPPEIFSLLWQKNKNETDFCSQSGWRFRCVASVSCWFFLNSSVQFRFLTHRMKEKREKTWWVQVQSSATENPKLSCCIFDEFLRTFFQKGTWSYCSWNKVNWWDFFKGRRWWASVFEWWRCSSASQRRSAAPAVTLQCPSVRLSVWIHCFMSLLPHRQMVSASQDGKLLIWDTFTGNKVRSGTLNSVWLKSSYM